MEKPSRHGGQQARAQIIKKLEQSVSHHSDPVFRVAQHLQPETGRMYSFWGEDNAGSIDFKRPEAFTTTKNFVIPNYFDHTSDGSAPFSRAVRDGMVLVMWLKPQAIPEYLPPADGLELLGKRVEKLAAALGQRFDISPLEARVFMPTAKVREKAAALGHPMGPALLLGTDAGHVETLRTAVYKHLRQLRLKALEESRQQAQAQPNPPSADALSTMLAPHRAAEGDEAPWTATHTDMLLPIADLMMESTRKPQLLNTPSPDTSLHLQGVAADGGKLTWVVTAQQLGLPKECEMALLVPLVAGYATAPGVRKSSLSPERQESVENFCDAQLRSLLHSIAEECGPGWHGSACIETPVGNFMLISATGEYQKQRLQHLLGVLQEVSGQRDKTDNSWAEYLHSRGIDHNPPPVRR